MNELIGLGGRLRSGKDTVADYLVQEYGYVKMGMSDILNDCLMTLNPILETDNESPWAWRYADAVNDLGYTDAKEQYPEIRRLLQMLGTEIGRNLIDEDVWVHIMRRRIRKANQAGKRVVVTGLRFTNELDMIEREAGDTWWIDRGGVEGSGHASEKSVTPADFERHIYNYGGLEELYAQVDRVFATV